MNRTRKGGKRFDVIGLGSCAVDLLGYCPFISKTGCRKQDNKAYSAGEGANRYCFSNIGQARSKGQFRRKIRG